MEEISNANLTPTACCLERHPSHQDDHVVIYLTLTVQASSNLTNYAIALSFGVTSAIVSAEHLKVVFSSGSSAIGSSTVIYDSYPNDHSPCYTTGNGRTFTIHGDC